MRWGFLFIACTACSLSIDLKGSEGADAELVDGAIDLGAPDFSAADMVLADDAALPDLGPDAAPVCDPGWHDGGDGRCVPEGSCVPEFALRFADRDGDGFGAGQAECQPVDQVGWSDVDTDCDDTNDAIWRLAADYLDADGDGWTVASPEICAGPADPAARPANSPPHYGFAAAVVEYTAQPNGDKDVWEGADRVLVAPGNATCKNRRHLGCDPLIVRGYPISPPPDAQVVGVVVHVVRRADDGKNKPVEDAVTLIADGVASEARSSEAEWTDEWVTAPYGARDDAWGLDLTAEAVADPMFGVAFDFFGPAGDVDLRHIHIEVYFDRGDDCDDDVDTIWSPLAGFADLDGDTWGGAPASACSGAALPEDFSQRAGDCFDGNAQARPGNAPARVVDRGDGSYDYDCDGEETATAVFSASSCAQVGANCEPMNMPVEPAACGQTNVVLRCELLDGGCAHTRAEELTACR